MPEILAKQLESFRNGFVLFFGETLHVLHQLESVNHLLDGVVPLAHILEIVWSTVLSQLPERDEARGNQTG